MKVKMEYNGKTVEVDVADSQFKQLFEETKTGWERAYKNGTYYFITNRLNTASAFEQGIPFDNKCYTAGNYFTDKRLANDMERAISLWLRIQRRASEICEPVDWNNVHTNKYSIIYNYIECELKITQNQWLKRAFQVYFDTENHAEQIVSEFNDELLWYFTEFRNRMDA